MLLIIAILSLFVCFREKVFLPKVTKFDISNDYFCKLFNNKKKWVREKV